MLLERGKKVKVRLNDNSLRIGSECNVCICRSTSRIIRVIGFEDVDEGIQTEHETEPSAEELASEQEALSEEVELGDESFLGEQRCEDEDLELEDSELLEWESSRDTEI